MKITILIFSFIFNYFQLISSILITKAWQSINKQFNFPENSYSDINNKDNIGITFSGGGDRSYIATIGYLSSFHELNYINKIKYIAGSSGGSWATVVYSYYQNDNITDNQMLGKIIFPEDIIFSNLSYIEEGCVRSYVNSSYILTGPLFSDWLDAVQAIYFTPAGILRNTPFSYDQATVADIKSRNSGLASKNFLLLRGKFGNTNGIDTRPFPIIQGTLIGPLDLIPFTPINRNYTLVEWTPLSAGVAYSNEVVFRDLNNTKSISTIVGGLIEPFAFNSLTSPTIGLPAGQPNGTLTIPGPTTTTQCDWALGSGTSSWAVGCAVSASVVPAIQLTVGTVNYWAPSESIPKVSKYTVGDGAGVSNTNLISLIQRGVKTIIAFVSTSTPLQNSTNWNPVTDTLTQDVIDFTVPAWFGYYPSDLSEVNDVSYDLKNSHIFDSSEWIPMVTSLQNAQAIGKGNIISMVHTTINNDKYGIIAGQKIKVVWIYLGRALQWEAKLNDEMKNLVVPKDDPYNQANTIDSGPFRHFPHYPTAIASETAQKANLLADLVGWTIYQNQDIIRDALGLDPLYPTQQPTSSSNDKTKSSNDDDNNFANSTGGIVLFVFIGLLVLGLIFGAIFYQIRRNSNSKEGLLHTNTNTNTNTITKDSSQV